MEKRKFTVIFLILISIVLIFHLLIITQIIPYEFAWGGKIKTETEMVFFEIFSILVNLILGFILLMKGVFIRPIFSEKTIDKVLWFFLALFLLNTVGNLFAETNFEKAMSILTLIFSFLIWKILKPKQTSIQSEKG